MPKTKISEFSATPGNNTDIDGINISEGCAPSGINDAIRELMSQLKDFQAGTAGDSFNGPVGTTTAAAGAFTTLSSTGNTTLGDAAGDTVTVNGTATFANANPTLSAGTANGVAYLNGSKVLTTGSGLVFDGSNLGLGVTPSAWNASSKAVQIPSGNLEAFGSGALNLTFNAFRNTSGQFIYNNNGNASIYGQNSGRHEWYTAPSGTAGNAVTFTQAMTLDASGNWLLGTTSAVARATVAESVSGGEADLLVWNPSGSSGDRAALYLSAVASTPNLGRAAAIKAVIGSSNDHSLLFFTNGAFADPVERARIDSSGNLLLNTTSSRTGVNSISIEPSGNNYIEFRKSGSGSATQIQFNRNTDTTPTSAGSIATTGTTTSYNTSSDYRLKNSIAPMTGALAKVALLKPVTYKWNADGSDGEGFIAHELAEVVPQCVTGEKDAVDAEGNPVYQGIDTSFLAGLYAAALQELMAEVNSLKAEIAALKA